MAKLPKMPKLPTMPDLGEIKESNSSEVEVTENKKPVIPKSQYDVDGNPILTIPDLDDINLTDEIDKYLGEE